MLIRKTFSEQSLKEELKKMFQRSRKYKSNLLDVICPPEDVEYQNKDMR